MDWLQEGQGKPRGSDRVGTAGKLEAEVGLHDPRQLSQPVGEAQAPQRATSGKCVNRAS